MKLPLFLIAFLSTVLIQVDFPGQEGHQADMWMQPLVLPGCQGTLSLSYVNMWRFGARQKLGIGLGGRFTTYLAANQCYVTAPAKLTSGSTSPLIIFQDNIAANMDTFLIKSPQVNSINVSIHIDYQLSKKINAGFNIDALGFSFGG